MTTNHARAAEPEDLARLFVERAQASDAHGLAELYEPNAVLGYPPGQTTIDREAIHALFEQAAPMLAQAQLEAPLPTLRIDDLALTATRPRDGTGGRAQV